MRFSEIVDLSSATTSCQNLPDYPLSSVGTIGGLIQGKTPLVCGGMSTTDCYELVSAGGEKRWLSTFPMTTDRWGCCAGMPGSPFGNSSHKFYAVGVDNAEVLTDSGWEVIGPALPKSVYSPCLMTVDDTTVLLAAGSIVDKETNSRETNSRVTYIFNSVKNSWTPGPLLLTGRKNMGCGSINENSQSNRKLLIVAGGENAYRSVEILDGVGLTSQWRQGNCLLMRSYGSIQ
jgi:hypothetical protein